MSRQNQVEIGMARIEHFQTVRSIAFSFQVTETKIVVHRMDHDAE